MSGNADRADRKRALAALVLLVPAPSIGAIFGLALFPDTALGAGVFAASKLWILVLPAIFWIAVERRPLRIRPPSGPGLGFGVASGLVLSAVILGASIPLSDVLIDRAAMREALASAGLGTKPRFAAAAVYWVVVNSLLEEYVWRWFCVRQCQALMPSGWAIVCGAFLFTIHHIFAMAVYLGPPAVTLASIGVFVGGVIWSYTYVRYRSLWPGWVSHALVDAALFGLGAWILFGRA